MVEIITQSTKFGTAEDFTDAITAIEENLDQFEDGDKIVLVDFETKNAMFLKVSLRVEEY
jgi:hypothetical protein